MCSLCGGHYETTQHLFLDCGYAKLWDWLGDVLNSPIGKSSFSNVMKIFSKNWSQ